MSILELPEIETLRRDLDRDITTRKVKSAEVVVLKSFPGMTTKKEFDEYLIGAKVDLVERVGMAIVVRLDNEYAVTIHLGEHGRLERSTGRTKVGSDVVAIVGFTQGGDLRIADQKGSSQIHVVHNDALATVLAPPETVGLDLLENPISWVEFGRFVKARNAPLKLMLTDPSIFVGIGDIYSNEILFDSGLRHDRASSQLSTQEIRRLYRSVVGIMHEAIKYRGTSTEARPFFDLSGEPGEFAEHLAVFGKDGDLSPRSREPIQKTSFKHQVVYFCKTQV